MTTATPPFRIKGYYADANILGHEREIQYDPNEGGLWITCSYSESHEIVNRLIGEPAPVTDVIAMLSKLEPEKQDELLTLIVNAVTGNRKATRVAGRRAGTITRTRAPLTEEQEERAAIMEVDGGVSREEAEAAVSGGNAAVTVSNVENNNLTSAENPHPSELDLNLGSTQDRPGINPDLIRAQYDALEDAAKHEAEEEERRAEYERHQTRQDARGALSAAADVARAENPPVQTRLAYEPEPGQRIREAPHAGVTVDAGVVRSEPGGPAVYEVGKRAPSGLDEFFADGPASEPVATTKPSNGTPSALPADLAKANTLRPVFEYLYAQGHTTAEALAEEAFKLKDAVPFVSRVNGLEGRARDWLTRMKEISGV